MAHKPIYLDYMATTPCDPRVIEVMQDCLGLEGCFGNASSLSHVYGQQAHERVNQARVQLASLINADPNSIIWTSGATEGDNLAILGVLQFYRRKGKHIITMSCEHVAVLDCCGNLSSQGYEVTYLDPLPNGQLDIITLQNAIRDDTVLVSIMHVNNETGVVQDIGRIGCLLRERGVLFHVDAAQSLGKLPIDCQELSVDLMSFSAHKIYGPKGVGGLYIRSQPKLRLTPMIYGGGQERGMRSGTLATHQIVGMGKACEIAAQRREQDYQHVTRLAEQFWQGISELSQISLNGDTRQRYPGCLNIHFAGIEGDTLMSALTAMAISRGSACNAVGARPSHVLLAYGLTPNQANQSLRFSFGRHTTSEDVQAAVEQINEVVPRLRAMSPIWCEAS